jgi:hypothetical protein
MPNIELTPQQQVHEKNRYIFMGELLSAGASIDKHGRLDPTVAQKNILKPQVKEFVDNTPEGQALKGHYNDLDAFETAIGSECLQWAVKSPGTHKMEDFRDHFTEAGIDVEWNRLLIDPEDSTIDRNNYARQVQGQIETYKSRLNQLAEDLTLRPQYRFGSCVSVERSPKNGQPAEVESGWIVAGISPKALLKVVSPDESLQKLISVADLDRINQTPELS